MTLLHVKHLGEIYRFFPSDSGNFFWGGGGRVGGGLSSLLMFTGLARKRTLNLKQTTINLVVVRKGCCVAI